MNKPVSPELAKLLKENGITIGGFKYYDRGDVLNHSVGFIYSNSGLVLAPTIAEVVMWLYEKYGIWIYLQPIWNNVNHTFQYVVFNLKSGQYIEDYKTFNSPIEAYEAAITYTLKNLLKNII